METIKIILWAEHTVQAGTPVTVNVIEDRGEDSDDFILWDEDTRENIAKRAAEYLEKTPATARTAFDRKCARSALEMVS